MNEKFSSVEEYISSFPLKTKKILKELRNLIKQTAPGAEELISYNMPAFKYHGVLVYYAGYKEHIGFYPANTAVMEDFKDELKKYRTSKGTIQLPLDEPLPANLIKKIVKLRIQQNLEKDKIKSELKKSRKK